MVRSFQDATGGETRRHTDSPASWKSCSVSVSCATCRAWEAVRVNIASGVWVCFAIRVLLLLPQLPLRPVAPLMTHRCPVLFSLSSSFSLLFHFHFHIFPFSHCFWCPAPSSRSVGIGLSAIGLVAQKVHIHTLLTERVLGSVPPLSSLLPPFLTLFLPPPVSSSSSPSTPPLLSTFELH